MKGWKEDGKENSSAIVHKYQDIRHVHLQGSVDTCTVVTTTAQLHIHLKH
jgi:hypothetical protein